MKYIKYPTKDKKVTKNGEIIYEDGLWKVSDEVYSSYLIETDNFFEAVGVYETYVAYLNGDYNPPELV